MERTWREPSWWSNKAFISVERGAQVDGGWALRMYDRSSSGPQHAHLALLSLQPQQTVTPTSHQLRQGGPTQPPSVAAPDQQTPSLDSVSLVRATFLFVLVLLCKSKVEILVLSWLQFLVVLFYLYSIFIKNLNLFLSWAWVLPVSLLLPVGILHD